MGEMQPVPFTELYLALIFEKKVEGYMEDIYCTMHQGEFSRVQLPLFVWEKRGVRFPKLLISMINQKLMGRLFSAKTPQLQN